MYVVMWQYRPNFPKVNCGLIRSPRPQVPFPVEFPPTALGVLIHLPEQHFPADVQLSGTLAEIPSIPHETQLCVLRIPSLSCSVAATFPPAMV